MVTYRGEPEVTHFLNVDLDVYSKYDLQPLVSTLGRKVLILYVGRDKRTYCAHLELSRITKTADAAILAFCALIRGLPRAERRLWNTAKVRDFNIGVQAGHHPLSSEFALTTASIQGACEVGARIVFTVYAPERVRKSPVRR